MFNYIESKGGFVLYLLLLFVMLIFYGTVTEIQKERAEFEFTTHFRDTHYLWIVDNNQYIEKLIIRKFTWSKIEKIYRTVLQSTILW